LEGIVADHCAFLGVKRRGATEEGEKNSTISAYNPKKTVVVGWKLTEHERFGSTGGEA